MQRWQSGEDGLEQGEWLPAYHLPSHSWGGAWSVVQGPAAGNLRGLEVEQWDLHLVQGPELDWAFGRAKEDEEAVWHQAQTPEVGLSGTQGTEVVLAGSQQGPYRLRRAKLGCSGHWKFWIQAGFGRNCSQAYQIKALVLYDPHLFPFLFLG